jgi:polyhydroxybutyrate depolymerase
MNSKNLFFLIGLIFIHLVNISASEIDSIYVDEIKREYLLHIPASYTDTDSVPLFIGLHYLGSNGSQFESSTKFSVLADKHNFIAIYPNGIGGSWNGGGCCNPAVSQNIDDVKFISEIIDTMKAKYNIDSTRIFVGGFSNGSIMAYRIANELSEKISAVGCVSGQSFQDIINPANSVPIIHFHAMNDNSVNFNGGIYDS